MVDLLVTSMAFSRYKEQRCNQAGPCPPQCCNEYQSGESGHDHGAQVMQALWATRPALMAAMGRAGHERYPWTNDAEMLTPVVVRASNSFEGSGNTDHADHRLHSRHWRPRALHPAQRHASEAMWFITVLSQLGRPPPVHCDRIHHGRSTMDRPDQSLVLPLSPAPALTLNLTLS